MVVNKVTGYGAGETSSRYFGSAGSAFTDQGFFYCRNGLNTSTTLSKRSGTEYVMRTPDNNGAKLYNLNKDIMVTDGTLIYKYHPDTNLFEGDEIVKVLTTGDDYTYTIDKTLIKGTILHKPDCGYYIVDSVEASGVGIQPMMGREQVVVGDALTILKSATLPTEIAASFPNKNGLIVLGADKKLYTVNNDLTFSAFSSTGLKGDVISATIYQNRFVVLSRTADTTYLQLSAQGAYNNFAVGGSATNGLSLTLAQIIPDDAKWVASAPKGLVVGTLQGIYSFIARNINNIIDATQPIIPDYISPIGASSAEPAPYKDMLLFIDHSGTDINVIKPDLYTDAFKVNAVSKNFEQPEVRGSFTKILNFAHREQNILLLSDEGNLSVCRPITDQNGGLSLGAAEWSFGYLSRCQDVCRIRTEGQHDALMLSVYRQMSYGNGFSLLEIWRPMEEVPRPWLESQVRFERIDEDDLIYNEVLKQILVRHPHLDCYERYAPFKNFKNKMLVYDKEHHTLHCLEDLFTKDMEGASLIANEKTILTIEKFVSPNVVKVFPNAPADTDILHGGFRVGSKFGIHKDNYRFVTNKIKCTGPLPASDFQRPVIIVDGTKELDEKSYDKLPEYGEYELKHTMGSEFIIGIPYMFLYISNASFPVNHESSKRPKSVAMRTIFSGQFQAGMPYTNKPNYENSNPTGTGLPYSYESVSDFTVAATGRLQTSRFMIRQKNIAPLHIVDMYVRFGD